MSTMTLRTVHFHGSLAKEYGKSVTLAAANMFQLMSGLTSRFGPAFKETIRSGKWHVTDGSAKVGNDLGDDEVRANHKLKKKTLHIMPAVEGASAVLRVVIGIVLIIVGAYFDQPWLVQMGIAMALGGAAELLTKSKLNTSTNSSANQRTSSIYNGAVNVDTQGGPVPLTFGRVRRASSVLISTDFSSDDL